MDENYLNKLLKIPTPKMSQVPKPEANLRSFNKVLDKFKEKNKYSMYMSTKNGNALTVDESLKILESPKEPFWLKEQAFKKIVNENAKQLNLKPLNFNASLDDFNKLNEKTINKYTQLQNYYKELQSNSRLNLNVNLNDLKVKTIKKTEAQRILEKARNRESMTNEEMKKYSQLLSEMGSSADKNLTNLGKTLANIVLVKPFNYGKELVKRDPNILIPLSEDTEKLGKAGNRIIKRAFEITYNDAKKLLLLIYGIKGVTGDKDGLIAAGTRRLLTYEQELIRDKKSKTFVKDMKTIKNALEKGFDFTVDTAKFVKEHPVEAGVIAVTSISNFGKALYGKAKEDPEEAMAQALSFFIPGMLVKAGKNSYVVLRNSKAAMKFFSKLQELNPNSDFVIKYAGKGFEKHKGAFDQFLIEFKGDVIKTKHGSIGVIRVQKPSLKNPTSWFDKLKGKRPGQFKKVYKLSSKEILVRNTPSEFADVITELRKGGKKELIAHATPDASFLKKALKKGSFEVKYDTNVIGLTGRYKVGGIEMGMFYAPTTSKPIFLDELGKVVKPGTPQIYTFYANLNTAKLSDVVRGKAIFRLSKQRGIFMKESKIDKLSTKTLKKKYEELSHILGNDVGKTKLSASTLKRIRTELEVIDSPFTKNLVTKQYSIKLPNGEKFLVFAGRTKKLTKTELAKQIEKYINSKFERINNAIAYAVKNPSKIDDARTVVKMELNSIKYLAKKLDELKANKIINKIKEYQSKLGIESLKLTPKEQKLYKDLLNKIISLEKEYYSKGAKIYSLNELARDLLDYSYKIKKVLESRGILSKKNSSKASSKSINKTLIKTSKSSKTSKKKSVSKSKSIKSPKKISKISSGNIKVGSIKTKNFTSTITKEPSFNISKTSLPRLPSVPSKPSTKVPVLPPTNRILKRLKTPSSSLKSQKQLIFDIRYRERKNKALPGNSKTNPVIVKIKKVKLPLNRAFKYGSKLTDNSLVRSFELIPVGVKTIKDDAVEKKLLQKFSLRKNKNVLKFVEKKKYTRDTLGEKRELKKIKKK